MKKARKKFVLYAMLSIFVLLTVLLSVINMIVFEMAAHDADDITMMLARGKGNFMTQERPAGEFGGRGPMGPTSPEMNKSIRYFTFAFDSDGSVETVAFQLSAMSEDEARELASSLTGGTCGWVKMTYRYRVWSAGGKTFVTVIDQGRELLVAYRILIFSVAGEILGLAISFLFLMFIGKKLFSPLETADAKQKNFIAEAEAEFKVPLTVIGADIELIERDGGANERTSSVRRQVRKMTELVKNLGSLAIFDQNGEGREEVSLSKIMRSELDSAKAKFDEAGIILLADIGDDISIYGDKKALERVMRELVDNSLKFACKQASFSLTQQSGRIRLTQKNGTTLQNGGADQVFDRFTTLENAAGKIGHGLGLAYVKDAVKAHNGRATAKVDDGEFILEITL